MARKAKQEAPNDGELPFEVILERLEGVVEALEQGDTPLEEALATFEQGVALSRLGAARLDEAERRIEVLLSDEPGATRPLDGEPSDHE
jgi:exodeoxyribonuclease VII small subunit